MNIFTAIPVHDGLYFEYATNAKDLFAMIAGFGSGYECFFIMSHNDGKAEQVKYNYASLAKAIKAAKDLGFLFSATIYDEYSNPLVARDCQHVPCFGLGHLVAVIIYVDFHVIMSSNGTSKHLRTASLTCSTLESGTLKARVVVGSSHRGFRPPPAFLVFLVGIILLIF